MSDKIQLDYGRLQALLFRIELALPTGYQVTLLARHPTNPKGHVLLGNDDFAVIRRTLELLEAPDIQVLPAGALGPITPEAP